MNKAKVLDSISRSIRILKQVGLYLAKNNSKEFTLSGSKFSSEFSSVCHKNDYQKIYQTAMSQSDYDVILIDNSFIQFSMFIDSKDEKKLIIRYAYYPNPSDVDTYEEFLKSIDLDYDECKDMFIREYEQYTSEAKVNSGVCPIRYDYNYEIYDGIKHSISHLHIGHNNKVRIPCDKIFLPEKFILFIIRNAYPEKWSKIVDLEEELFKNCLSMKLKCPEVDSDYFDEDERKIFYLS